LKKKKNKESTFKPVYNNHPWDSKKVAVVEKCSLFRGWSLKITFNTEKLGRSLFRSGVQLQSNLCTVKEEE
jgi:hypothetical protein